MKHLLLALLLLPFAGFSQTGSLVARVTFVYDNGCSTINVRLTSDSTELLYQRIGKTDTISGIPAGTYSAHFYSCDSTINYTQPLEIVKNEVLDFTFYNNARQSTDDTYLYDYYDEFDSSYESSTVFVQHNWQFGRGLDIENTANRLQSNYAFQYSVNQDFLLGNSPFAIGYECGLNYKRLNYDKMDFYDSSVVYDGQHYHSLDFSIAALSSIYIKNRKFLSFGVKYNLPMFARAVKLSGNDKISTKGIQNFNDVTLVAAIGYWWGFVFAEYQLTTVLSAPYENAPPLTLGVRFSFPIEWY